MRILPRVNMPTPKAARRLWRQSKGHLTVRRVYYSTEFVLFGLIFFLVFSGGRLRFIDSYGRRTDLLVSLLLFGTFVLVNSLARRRVLPKIELYYETQWYEPPANLRPALKRAWISAEVMGSDHCPVGLEIS